MHKSINIGRPSVFGNPFHIGRDGTREEVVAKHREWFLAPEQEWIRRLARELPPGSETWCPGCRGTLPCHKTVIEEVRMLGLSISQGHLIGP